MWQCPPRSVLVPVDFGDASARAVSIGALVASAHDVPLVALHAETLEAPPYFTHQQIDALEAGRRAARNAATDYVRRFVAAHTAYPADVRLVEQPPAEAILEASRSVDLVVMGTHGRRGPSRWWLGSVAERLIRVADTPVLVVRAEDPAQPAAEVFSRILTMTHRGSPVGVASVWADTLASIFAGEVHDGGTTETCDLDAVRASSLVVISLPSDHAGRSVADSVVTLLRTCGRPALFVPEGREVGGSGLGDRGWGIGVGGSGKAGSGGFSPAADSRPDRLKHRKTDRLKALRPKE